MEDFETGLVPRGKAYVQALVCTVILAVVASWIYEGLRRNRERDVVPHVLRHAAEFKVDPYLVMAIISVESNFRPKVVGGKGEIGLVQIMPYNARRGAKALDMAQTDREYLQALPRNVRLGCWYLSKLKKNHSEWPIPYLAAEYNAGWPNVSRWKKMARRTNRDFVDAITFPSTKLYVQLVVSEYRRYRQSRVFHRYIRSEK